MKNQGFVYTFFSYIVRPQYQAVTLFISSCIIFLMLYFTVQSYRPLEQSTQLLPITPKKIKEWGGEPTVVQTGLYITNWHEFDVQNNQFVFDGIVWFQFDPALISIDTIEKFSFEKGDIIKKSKPDTRLIDGQLFVEYQIRIRFTTNLSHKLFPIDDHIIYIGMINTSVTPSEVLFKVNRASFGRPDSVQIPDWKQIAYTVSSGYERLIIDKRDQRKVVRIPKVVYGLDFRRSGVNLILLILLPIFLIFFISLFSFSFNPETAQMPIVLIATTALTSLVAYRFIIQNLSPRAGYFLLSDLVFSIFLAFSFMVFVIGIGVVYLNKLPRTFVIFRGIIFLLFHVIVIVSLLYLFFYWVR